MSTVVLVAGATRTARYANFGFYGGSTIRPPAVGLPLVIVGSWLGDRVAHNLNPRIFGSRVAGLVLLAGIALFFR